MRDGAGDIGKEQGWRHGYRRATTGGDLAMMEVFWPRPNQGRHPIVRLWYDSARSYARGNWNPSTVSDSCLRIYNDPRKFNEKKCLLVSTQSGGEGVRMEETSDESFKSFWTLDQGVGIRGVDWFQKYLERCMGRWMDGWWEGWDWSR